jgi:hypothetical protein
MGAAGCAAPLFLEEFTLFGEDTRSVLLNPVVIGSLLLLDLVINLYNK